MNTDQNGRFAIYSCFAIDRTHRVGISPEVGKALLMTSLRTGKTKVGSPFWPGRAAPYRLRHTRWAHFAAQYKYILPQAGFKL
jgi:hypothetical protein